MEKAGRKTGSGRQGARKQPRKKCEAAAPRATRLCQGDAPDGDRDGHASRDTDIVAGDAEIST